MLPIDFLDELGLFIEEKAVCPEKLGSPLLSFPFNLETSPFGLLNDPIIQSIP
jgi:hypothetical protein